MTDIWDYETFYSFGEGIIAEQIKDFLNNYHITEFHVVAMGNTYAGIVYRKPGRS